jgi:hypothetical protein
MDLPDTNTLKILEERKNYLNKRIENNTTNDYTLAEIGAIDRIINFFNLMRNNISDEIIRTIVEKQENRNEKKLIGEKYNGEGNYEIVYSYEKELSKNYKLDISFVEYKEERQILLSLKKYKKEFFKWVSQGKVRLDQTILEEILKKSNEI